MVALSALVSGLDAELVRLGYKDSTMVWYRGCWRRLGRFFAARGVEEFSLDVAMAWVDAACGGFFDKERAGTLKPTEVYLFRVAQMLGDYVVHGAVLRRYCRSADKVTGTDSEVIARFQERLRADGRAVSTVRAYGTLAGEFVAFVNTCGGLTHLDADVVGAFVATLSGYQVKTVEQKLCAVRSFVRFASADGLVDAAVLDAVPAVRSSKQTRIPSVWDPGDVARILDAVDRGNPCGKRDYAIILLVARLGLRGIDVKRLEFADFDWPGNRLSVIQAKTGRRVQLPLLKEVGWTVIDYAAGERVSAESAVQRPLPVPRTGRPRHQHHQARHLGHQSSHPDPAGHRKLSSHPERPRTGPHLHGDRHRQQRAALGGQPTRHSERARLRPHHHPRPARRRTRRTPVAQAEPRDRVPGPQRDLAIVTHQRVGGFHDSELDEVLRGLGVDTVVFLGVATNASVESTARAASDLGYRVLVVSDACSAATPEAHAASLESLGLLAEITTADDLIAALTAQPADVSG